MAKLYPPYIEGTLPAFFYGGEIAVPFVMNNTVGWNEVEGFIIKIKDIQNNKTITTLTTVTDGWYDEENSIAYFTPNNKLTTGNHYKIQIAYINTNNEYGYYSTVGVVKYTTQPIVHIEGMQEGQLQNSMYSYIGVYNQQQGDVTEKAYSYSFTIYDEFGQLLETSGEQLHNHEHDEKIYESTDTYTSTKNLEENKIYKIIYTVTTANGVVASSPSYRIISQSTIPPEIPATLIATMNQENGYIDISLQGELTKDGTEVTGTGTFLICRSSSEDNYTSWQEIDRFVLFGDAPSSYHWKDFTVTHGFKYKYSLQQYNQNYQIYSDRMISNEIVAEFEHCYLYDGKRQLKIKYNPKISSFKETLLEQKTNTIGGKFPFFFRNGNVCYKEFPISGLISYLSDEEELFVTNEEMGLDNIEYYKREHSLKSNVHSKDWSYFNNMLDGNQAFVLQGLYANRENPLSQENMINQSKTRTTQLIDYNIVAERIFKMKVLEFLNDGKPKLFRSPAEGNYIVRLLNSSLTPADDKLSRMLHTFSTTATEIDEYNYKNLDKYNLISIQEPNTSQLRWKTINIMELLQEQMNQVNNVLTSDSIPDWIVLGEENRIQTLQCLDMFPGDQIKIVLQQPDYISDNIIQIGVTGAYYVEFSKPIKEIQIYKYNSGKGQITIGYEGVNLHHFDTYRKIKAVDIPIKQMRGSEAQGEEIKQAFQLEDIKHKVTNYYFLHFVKDYQVMQNMEQELSEIRMHYLNHEYTTEYYNSLMENIKQKYNFTFTIDGALIDLSEKQEYFVSNLEHVPEIILGSGICLNASIQRREIEYDIEVSNKFIQNFKSAYSQALSSMENYIKYNDIDNINENQILIDSDIYVKQLNSLNEDVQRTYKAYIDAITEALREKGVL